MMTTLSHFRIVAFSVLYFCFSPFISQAEKIRVVTTVSMATDMVKKIGMDRVEVEGLMGPGVDPHLYKATASDVLKLQNADVIFYVGLMLEGKMSDLFSKMTVRKKHVYPLSGSIPKERLLEPKEFQGHYDPHIWFDVELWSLAVEAVVQGLTEADPKNADFYKEQGITVQKEFQKLHEWALAKAAELPEEKRILVTSHDAYNYFGRAYGFKVVGLQGISTATEAGLADMAKLVDFIKLNGVKSIFVESSVPHHTIERISKDAGVAIGGELFSDALGKTGEIEDGYDLGTYEGMIKHNLNTIVNALK